MTMVLREGGFSSRKHTRPMAVAGWLGLGGPLLCSTLKGRQSPGALVLDPGRICDQREIL